MKRSFATFRAALLPAALALGLLLGCPNLLSRPGPSRSPGEGQVLVSLAVPGENAASPSARTALPRPAELFYTLVFTKGEMTVTKTLDQEAEMSLGLQAGDWTLAVTGFATASSRDNENPLATGSASISVVSGESVSATVDLTLGLVDDIKWGSIAYEIKFPDSIDVGTLNINSYEGSLLATINLLSNTTGNYISYNGSVATATGTINNVFAGYYQALVKLSDTTEDLHAGYTTMIQVYEDAASHLTKEFTAGHFIREPMVDEFDLTSLVAVPVKGVAPVTTLDATQYAGSIAWKKTATNTDVSGNFAHSTPYHAVVTLTAKTGFSFDGVGGNAFSYAGLPAGEVTNPAATGTGETITATISFPATAGPGQRYVKPSPAGLGNGSSWEHASDDLQKMLDEARADKAAESGITAIVRVAAGTYTPRYAPNSIGDSYVPSDELKRDMTFILRPGVEIWGGYPATATDDTPDTDRNRTANPTILSGDLNGDDNGTSNKSDNAYQVVLGVDIPNDGATILDGLVIQGGNANADTTIYVYPYTLCHDRGGGMLNHVSSPVLINVTIAGNSASGSGGGIYNQSSSPVLTNVTIAGNSVSGGGVSGGGGGMFNLYCSPVLTNVVIADNKTDSNGGGIFNSSSSSPVLTNVTIAGNSAFNGGGIFNNNNSSPVLTNAVIAGNAASGGGGGMYNYASSSPVLTNVTIAGNKAPADKGGGMHNSNSPAKIRNSIIWGNSSGIGADDSVLPDVEHSIVQGGWAGTLNMNIDPVFAEAANVSSAPTTAGDYHLQNTSPAINMGDNSFYPDEWAKWQAIESLIGGTILTWAVYNAHVLPALAKDLGGADRLKDAYTTDSSTDIDLGAYEEQAGSTPNALRYARADGTGGGSWTDASRDLQAMIDQAAWAKQRGAAQALVRVAAGTYTPLYAPGPGGESLAETDTDFIGNRNSPDRTFILRPGVEIRGGYTAEGEDIDEPTRKARFNAAGEPAEERYRAILSGDLGGDGNGPMHNSDNVHHVVLGVNIAAGSGTVLDGFTITGGNANGSGSITVDIGTIAQNAGGGIYNYSSSPVLTHVTIVENFANNNGGGIYNHSSSPVLTNVTIAENSVTSGSGGGIYNNSSSPVLTQMIIAGNTASGSGGGIYNNNSSPALTNVAITGNSAFMGGGIFNDFSSPVLTNVTIAGNSVDDGYTGGGIYNENSSEPKIRNSIIWGNWSGIHNENDGSFAVVERSIVQGSPYPAAPDADVSYIMNIDPVFVLPVDHSAAPTTEGDYRLQSTSPAINMGDHTLYPDSWSKWSTKISGTILNQTDYSAYVQSFLAKDLGGGDRVKPAGAIDLGAYEAQSGIAPSVITLRFADQGKGAFSEETFTLSKNFNDSQQLDVSGTGYSNPRWFVDGVQKSTMDEITIAAADYALGGHSLSLWVAWGGKPWSKTIKFRVTN